MTPNLVIIWMSSGVEGGPSSEVDVFLSKLIDGRLFEIDTAHPDAEAFQSALKTYNRWRTASAALMPQHEKDMEYAIGIAISQGVIKPKREVLDKFASEIKDKTVTEQDIDRVQGDSKAKQFLKGLLSKVVEKTHEEIVEMLYSAAKTHGWRIVFVIVQLITHSNSSSNNNSNH
jgi:hypothetical protein